MILVTGANGFVGRALMTRLAASGVPARGASRLPRPGCSAVGEIDSATAWGGLLPGVSAIVHLAARVHVMTDGDRDPLRAYRRVNVEGTLNLARQAAAAGVRRFVFVSSIKVNGEGTAPGRPYTAAARPAPEDPYGVSKLEAEDGLRALAAETGLEVATIRPVLVYGPGVRANFLTLMRALYRGWPLPLGAIHNRRSLVAIDNLVDLIDTCTRHPHAAGGTFLVSDGEDLSTTDLLRRMAAALEVKARLVPVPPGLLAAGARFAGRGAMAKRILGSLQVDITQTNANLGWTPPVTVDAALAATARYFIDSNAPS